jgi:F-type H+-transporting ATPase subunit alpha
MDDLTKKKSLDDDLKNRLHAALKEYKENFKSERDSARESNAAANPQKATGKGTAQAPNAKKSEQESGEPAQAASTR